MSQGFGNQILEVGIYYNKDFMWATDGTQELRGFP